MGKFGKKNEVSLNPLKYNITILGESGIGKTTLAKEVCEKLVGDEGYIHFDIGQEAGADAIQGIVTEKIENAEKLREVVDDIVENKDSDYPNLQVVIWDTLDELIPLVEKEIVRQYNKTVAQDKKVDSISAAYGGFMRGQDKAAEYIVNTFAELRSVGVSSIVIGHVRRTDITDPITQETYSKLTADTTQRYFNVIKNKQHFVALAYIDRDIVKEKTGRKNIATKQDITINKAVSESRIISFRDDTYSVDSKSRFADIIDRIPFDRDEFIKAMQDAILAEQSKGSKSLEQTKKEQEAEAKEDKKRASEASAKARAVKAAAEEEANRDEYLDTIKAKFSGASDDVKAQAKKMLADAGFKKFTEDDVPVSLLKEVADLL